MNDTLREHMKRIIYKVFFPSVQIKMTTAIESGLPNGIQHAFRLMEQKQAVIYQCMQNTAAAAPSYTSFTVIHSLQL